MINNMYIKNNNDENIFVEIYEPKYVKETVVFCHGITGCRKGRTIEDDYFQQLASRFLEMGYKVILFDFSGHGYLSSHEITAAPVKFGAVGPNSCS